MCGSKSCTSQPFHWRLWTLSRYKNRTDPPDIGVTTLTSCSSALIHCFTAPKRTWCQSQSAKHRSTSSSGIDKLRIHSSMGIFKHTVAPCNRVLPSALPRCWISIKRRFELGRFPKTFCDEVSIWCLGNSFISTWGGSLGCLFFRIHAVTIDYTSCGKLRLPLRASKAECCTLNLTHIFTPVKILLISAESMCRWRASNSPQRWSILRLSVYKPGHMASTYGEDCRFLSS